MSVSQISVFLENKTGALNNLTSVLSDNGINIQAMSVAETSEFGIVRMIVDDAFDASTYLKDAGYIARVSAVVCATISDEPGSLHRIIDVLNNVGIDVEYMYAFLGGRKENHAHIIMKVADNEKAEAALRKAGIELLDED